MSALTLFPARIRFVNPDGTLTVEALRMLDLLVSRVGGTLGDQGADLMAAAETGGVEGHDTIAQPVPPEHRGQDIAAQPPPAVSSAPEMIMQPPPITADQVSGLGTMAAQNVGTNFTGSFTGKTVTVANGIITQVV